MNNHHRPMCSMLLLTAALLGLLPLTANAQPGEGTSSVPVLTGSASAEIKGLPDTLYMTVAIQGRGSDVKTALASLEKRRQKAIDKLAKLGANKDSVEFGDLTLSTGMSQEQQQMQQMFQQQMRARGKAAVKMPEIATVSRQLVAEWSLQAKSSEELLLQSAALTKKIRDADVAGANDGDQLTPEEEELAEEMEGLREQMGMSGIESNPGDPNFIYLSRITDEQHNEAIVKAFGKAKGKAGELATAAGVNLGSLWTIVAHDHQSQMETMARQSWGYNRYGRGRQQATIESEDGEHMAIAYRPGEVTYTVYVQAAFRFELAQE